MVSGIFSIHWIPGVVSCFAQIAGAVNGIMRCEGDPPVQATASETSAGEPLGALHGHVFGSGLLSAMEAGLEEAWERLGRFGAVYCSPRFAAETRTHLARSIIQAAADGESRPERLSEHAVSCLFPLGLASDDMPPRRVSLGLDLNSRCCS